ncbi:MAG TPA: PBP1A family penicillin-binding protein [Terriglobia bacterium]
MQSQLRRYLGSLVFVFLLCLSIAVGATAGVLFVYNSDLPQINSLEDYHPSLVTDVYSDDGQVIGSFALERRIVVTYDQIPQLVKDAIVSVEDQNFYPHWGIDIYGVARAALKDLMAGRVVEGGSTLTQQLSKNLFLTPERKFRRKIQEAMLAIQIERYYTKGQILTMYVNQHFMGHGQYGFAAAADYYFGKQLKDLNIEEAAMLAALPRSPINYDPIQHRDRARMRRDYAIDRMVAEKKITVAQGEEAKSHEIKIAEKQRPDELAPYFVEELRRYLEKKYGTSAVHEGGLKVYSTLNVDAQKAANAALRTRLREYDKRHGWRGADRDLVSEGVDDLESFELPDWKLPIRTNDIVPGIVLDFTKTDATVKIGTYLADLRPQDIAWTNAKAASDILKRGDVALFQIRSMNPADEKVEVSLEQKPKAQAAFVSIEPKTGEIKALVGGYDFDESKFDRATQAMRQTGSSFKPYVYTAAIDSGLITIDDTIVDSPVSYGSYSPGNYDGKFEGTIGIRRAFADSRNVPAVKILARLGVQNLVPYLRRFGITSKIEPVLPIALGAADVTLMEMVSAYSTFPNDGVRVVPQMIRRVTDYEGNVLEENFAELRDVISQDTARTMVELMQEPIKPGGTAEKAAELKRPIAGKTGTTNDFTDAWFIGYTPSLVAGAWVGFDEKVTLGDKETGARAALPIWMDFMRDVYKDKPIEQFDLTPKPTTAAPETAPSATRPGQ